MRKLIYGMMVSLDGFVARLDGALDWVLIDEEMHTFINNQERETGLYVYGRNLYETMRYWQTADQDPTQPAYELEYAKIWQAKPKIVFSATLNEVEGNTQLVREDAVAEIRRLKQGVGLDIDVGGPTLASALIRHNLIDEYKLFLQPVILGEGIPFLPPGVTTMNLRLVETRPFQSGIVYLRYQTK
ncbi:MAG: dihydrofolate reductase family protein [Candidatus Promineifilaceae bacterium]|jgi:dihydrofolate reductase|nr:dihydrofolate reductase family protein [Anaerolineaceae bacterium]